MKAKLVLFVFVLAISVFSCEKIEEWTAVEVDTELNVDIQLEGDKDASAKSATVLGEQEYKIMGKGSIDLSNHKDLKDFVNGIKNIAVNNATLEAVGLSSSDKIIELSLNYGFSESTLLLFKKFDNIDGASLSKNLDGIQTMIDVLKSKGFNKPIYFSVSGKSNFDPNAKQTKVKLNLPSKVKYTPF
jgi:hypothetical protein